MPYGFCNSPAVFNRFVSCVFEDFIMQDVLHLYIDDIYANTIEECMSKLRAVLNQAAKFTLKIKWSKCHFLKNRIDFLGHTVEIGKIRPGQEKTQPPILFGVDRIFPQIHSRIRSDRSPVN